MKGKERNLAAGGMSFIIRSDWCLAMVGGKGSTSRVCLSSSLVQSPSRPLRYVVLGAGFVGLSVVWHLLKHSPKELNLSIDLYDKASIGGGAFGVSGGLLHPYSPKVKLLWWGAECWNECLKLLSISETAALAFGEPNTKTGEPGQKFRNFVVRTRGILKPAPNVKSLDAVNHRLLDAQGLVPDICLRLSTAFYMPDAVTMYPPHYLQGLFLACKSLVKELSTSGFGGKELCLHQKSITSLLELEGEYDAVIICVGAKSDMLPELSGKLPLRTCRGVIAHIQLPDFIGEYYPDHGPSILSEAWLAVQGTRSLLKGSTKEWKSRNSSSIVSADEASKALEELLPKASAIYPGMKNWSFIRARAGLRALPPMTPDGSPSLLGCVDDLVGKTHACKYWLFGGLGSRGLLYHGWFGKFVAQAPKYNSI